MKKLMLPLALVFICLHVCAQQTDSDTILPRFLGDRGEGIPTSMFGTYIRKREIIIYPFYEYYYDRNYEYKPQELGYGKDVDYRGKYTANEGVIFIGYGITDRLAVEFEASIISAALVKNKQDDSNMPEEIAESGLGDVEGQLRYVWKKETARKPEIFSFFEYVLPLQKDKKIIGTSDWEFKLGIGFIKGYSWGTLTVRTAVEYDGEESKVDFGEYAIEYLKRVSGLFRFAVIIEGSQDELELIADMQFHVSDHAFIRINNAFGITSKATDYAPELGIVFHF
jgi:hypothetical protein